MNHAFWQWTVRTSIFVLLAPRLAQAVVVIDDFRGTLSLNLPALEPNPAIVAGAA